MSYDVYARRLIRRIEGEARAFHTRTTQILDIQIPDSRFDEQRVSVCDSKRYRCVSIGVWFCFVGLVSREWAWCVSLRTYVRMVRGMRNYTLRSLRSTSARHRGTREEETTVSEMKKSKNQKNHTRLSQTVTRSHTQSHSHTAYYFSFA